MSKETRDLTLQGVEPQERYTQPPLGLQLKESKKAGPVECLGMTFPDDAARRAYFLEQLREKLQDPEFRKIEGFPIGEDEDILALSDPPYYTACPNPWISEFIAHWEAQKPAKPEGYVYQREPYAADVSEGKNDPIYNAHSYHTKVPYKAIIRYILHYTQPGDIVFDGFCGTGMTGVAAQLCGDKKTIESLGYRVLDNGVILDTEGKYISDLGVRSVLLNDISAGATFIAKNYCVPLEVNAQEFKRLAENILKKVSERFSYLFTIEQFPDKKSILEYSVWSDVFVCTNCGKELCYWDLVVDIEKWQIKDDLFCPNCGIELKRVDLERAFVSYFDLLLNSTNSVAKKYRVWDVWRNGNLRFESKVENGDRTELHDQESINANDWFPLYKIPEGDKTSDPFCNGIRFVYQYWTKRTLSVLSYFKVLASSTNCKHLLLFLITSSLDRLSIRNGFRPQHKNNKSRELGGPMPGNLYIPTFSVELNPLLHLRSRITTVTKMLEQAIIRGSGIISTQSTSSINIKENSLDYIFVDPPFGSNIMYSELSFGLESWLKVLTNNNKEAIVNKTQKKSEQDYTDLMRNCFSAMYRFLKPGKWITVEFHNSKNSIWTSIQEALTSVGFVVADVRTLSRNLNSLNQFTSLQAVKQDLIISAYKPNNTIEEQFKLKAGTEDGVWDFIRNHLKQLPVFVSKNERVDVISERQNYLLFDRMVAFHVQRGVTIPISATEFYQGLIQRFAERDGMFFLPDQVDEYDKKRILMEGIEQLLIFITDEASAIQWLKLLLKDRPQTFQEIHPQFFKEISGWQKYEKPLELLVILEQNFFRYDDQGEVPSQIHSYLSSNFKELRNLPKDDLALRAKAKDRWYVPDPNKAADLEKLREKALLREFGEYRESKQRRLKQFRLEAVRAGFKKAWAEKDYATIIEVGQKIPENVLQEDSKLLMYYDNAQVRNG